MDPAAANASYCAAFVDELVRAGLRHACACPGSRSTPLAVALAAHPGVRLWMHIDERSASYFALGMAKYLRRPVAILCSSGTAAANFMPAVVEARYARIPLLVLTADRPHELRDVGAPQSIDQIRLFGAHVKWFVEMALPEAGVDSIRYARAQAARALSQAVATPPGPVHLNFPFREPLIDAGSADACAREAQRPGPAHLSVESGLRTPDSQILARLAAELEGVERGLIVCGPQNDPEFPAAVAALAARLGFPILADPLSQVRSGSHDRALVIDAYDAITRVEGFAARYAPQVVIRFGAIPTSRPLVRYLEASAACRQIFIDGDESWSDTAALPAQVIRANPRLTAAGLLDALGKRPSAVSGADRAWSRRWLELNRLAREAIGGYLRTLEPLFEGKVLAELAALIPPRATLYVGNSMPVRDLDSFVAGDGRALRFLANRGANGIDGVVSSALGAAAAGAEIKTTAIAEDPRAAAAAGPVILPVILAIGDLSLYHDSNGLLAARRHGLRATIVMLNNDGGGIFSFLPQAAYPDHFEQLFGTPTGLDFSRLAALYGIGYARVATWQSLRSEVARALDSDGVNLIEVPTERVSNVRMHREAWQAVSAALAPTLKD